MSASGLLEQLLRAGRDLASQGQGVAEKGLGIPGEGPERPGLEVEEEHVPGPPRPPGGPVGDEGQGASVRGPGGVVVEPAIGGERAQRPAPELEQVEVLPSGLGQSREHHRLAVGTESG